MKKLRPAEGQRIKCFGRNDRLIGDGVYHKKRAVKGHPRAFVDLDDGCWAIWNSVKRWESEAAQAQHDNHLIVGAITDPNGCDD